MTKFRVRYKIGSAPSIAVDQAVTVEAAMFRTEGSFIDFYSDAVANVGGRQNPAGEVVFRVREDIVADIQRM